MDTLFPSPRAKELHQQIPTHLGGYQNIVVGKVKDGDLLVWTDDRLKRVAEFYTDRGYAAQIDEYGFVNGKVSVYRKLAVVRQGDLDRPPVDDLVYRTGPTPHLRTHGGPVTLPTDAAERKKLPLATGLIDYFPDALIAVAALSRAGNEQHNPGKPLHWDRSKSGDESDALMRHFLARGTIDTDGIRHSAKVAWRALANLQKELEAAHANAGSL